MVVLTVDDSDVNLAVYRGVLGRIPEVEVVSHTSPYAALAWAQERAADVVVVDYHMPELDGLGFVEQFRQLPGSRLGLVVMVTADTEIDVRHRALEMGANDFLTKPIDRIEFTARIRNLLEIARSRRQLADRAQWLREEVERATATLAAREIETIVRLTRAAESRDDVTGMHVIRVGHICAALARTIGSSEERCRMLLLAAPMHDIGKVATPDSVLFKPGPLTQEELETMKNHTIAGYEILKDSESGMLQCAAEIALTHHESFDGSGYPRGLTGTEIPLSGRLCSVADVFDALTSIRPYKLAWSIEKAVDLLDDGCGSHFDPDVVTAFHQSFDEIVEIKRRFADEGIAVDKLARTYGYFQ
ncbi:MAG TPA: HD domain-containing phosphohydrolase [Candidatus Tumulicola sp.]|jgi:putative two-component system response regulator